MYLNTLENLLSQNAQSGLNGLKNAGQACGIGSGVSPGGSPISGIGINRNGRRIFKCKDCVDKNVGYCSHCFKCGSEEHKRKDCLEN